MNCYFHNDVPAVSACSVCGVGLCPQCVDTSVHFVEGQNICRRCAPAKLEAANAAAKRDRGRFRRRFYVSLFVTVFFFIMAGITIWKLQSADFSKVMDFDNNIFFYLSAFLVVLLGDHLAFSKPQSECEQIKTTIWFAVNPQVGCWAMIFQRIFVAMLSFIIVPLYCFNVWRNVKACDGVIQQNDALLAQLAAINASPQA